MFLVVIMKIFLLGDKSIFGRMNIIRLKYDSRICITQLWFLPIRNVDDISVALKSLMEQNSVPKQIRYSYYQ